MNKMFLCLLLASFMFVGLNSSRAQTGEPKKDKMADGLNLVKVNLTALPIKNFSFQYERPIAKKISAAIGLRLMPQGNLPFSSSIEKMIDDEEAWEYLGNLEIGNFAITPEVRFYMGKDVLRGFYIAPFARYANYTAKMPFSFEYEDANNVTQEEDIPLSGNISSFTGGFMLGAQWKLSKLVYLDWWILGPHYGSSKGDISGKKTLSPEEQDGLRDGLEDLDDVFFVDGYEVNSSGARVNIKGPWGGVRAGLALGFRF